MRFPQGLPQAIKAFSISRQWWANDFSKSLEIKVKQAWAWPAKRKRIHGGELSATTSIKAGD